MISNMTILKKLAFLIGVKMAVMAVFALWLLVAKYANYEESQLPVDFTQDPFEALLKQDKFQTKYTGGTVLHLYMNERLHSVDSTREFLKTVMENFRLPYVTLTPIFSVCDKHGYINGEHEYCPKCDNEILENYTKEAS